MTPLRAIGDATAKPGDPNAPPADFTPPSFYIVAQATRDPHILRNFDAVQMPDDATNLFVFLDRSAVAAQKDPYLFSLFIDVSIDGGVNFGGVFTEKAQPKFIPRSWSLSNGGTYDIHDAMGDASRGIILPPDQGMGRLVRISVGSKIPVDVGVAYKTTSDPQSPAQPEHHSVAIDVGTSGGAYTAATTISWNHAGAASPSNYYARVCIGCTLFGGDSSTNFTVKWDTGGTNTTMNSIAGSSIQSNTFQVGLPGRAELFQLINPTAGTVGVSIACGSTMYGKGASSLTTTGTDQTTPSAHTATASGNDTAPTVNITSTATTSQISDCMAVEFGGASDPTATFTAISIGRNAGGQGGGSQYTAGTGGTVAMAYGLPSTLHWVISASEIVQAAAGGDISPWAHRFSRVLGVGPHAS